MDVYFGGKDVVFMASRGFGMKSTEDVVLIVGGRLRGGEATDDENKGSVL